MNNEECRMQNAECGMRKFWGGILLCVLALSSCQPLSSNAVATATPTKIVAPLSTATPTKIPPTASQAPTSTRAPEVTISAMTGNVYIRRGPHLAYNPISLLYKGVTTKMVARNVLSDWGQIIIPDSNSNETGWIYLKSQYLQVNGDVATLPEFMPNEYPVPAVVRNCTKHQMYVSPGDIFLAIGYAYPENEAAIYPGHYVVYDIDAPETTEVQQFDIREGQTVEINWDAGGDHKKCPATFYKPKKPWQK